MVKHPVVGAISNMLWSFNSSSQGYIEYFPHLEVRVAVTRLNFVLCGEGTMWRCGCISARDNVLHDECQFTKKPSCLQGKKFGELAYYFPDGSVFGLVIAAAA